MTTFVVMRNLFILFLCCLFWITVWRCSAAPGGSPLPQARAGGQTEFCDPRASLSVDQFFQALCLIQDPTDAKLILRSARNSALQPLFGNVCAIFAWGNSLGNRSESRTVAMPKNICQHKIRPKQRHNRLLNTNWLVGLRRITEFTSA